ncbi:MAG TPA: hypothetical protein VEF76_03765, partial [Patescibacteria group bacterium]|nr:hypothetical protein [Patescibacteria group bacterium]
TILLTRFMDMTPLQEANSTGEATVEAATQALLAANRALIVKVMIAVTAPFAVWWFWRCGYGYKRLSENKKIPNPMSWL